ncbi:hypothetical protein ECC18A13_p10090 (plasmid) [Enterobacter sp. 18A13]|nr:hypothetical protein ECC18A13_p10090 [Enterobacter sp. 18A13]
MPQSIKPGSGHASHRNREAVTLALQGRYCSLTRPVRGFNTIQMLYAPGTSCLLKQEKPIMLPSGKKIWQPEFPELTLSHKTGTVQSRQSTLYKRIQLKVLTL